MLPARISVVRCTVVPILQIPVMIAKKNKKTDQIFNAVLRYLQAMRKVAIAIEKVTTA